MADDSPWASRPVFISSTFLDMQAERDMLRRLVFPELEERLAARRRRLEWIDLRAGVSIADLQAPEQRELAVLKVCLEEVKRSRPFVIALIGHRYGWAPPAERMEAAAQEFQIEGELAGRSVTDLEIEFGVLADTDQGRRCFFFFRDPLPWTRMGPAAALYSDEAAGDAEAAAKLTALKARIEEAFPGRVRSYAATWDGARLGGLEALRALAVETIWAELDAEYPLAEPGPPVPWAVERGLLDDFVADRGQGFVGRSAMLAELRGFALSAPADDEPWAVSITGEAGSGKSALFARLLGELSAPTPGDEAEPPLVLAHAAGAGLQSAAVQPMLLRWIDELAGFLGSATGLSESPSREETDAAFASLIARAALRRRVVVMLDALDQFEANDRSQYLTWLPKPWPANARLIATAIAGQASEALQSRPGVLARAMPPLDEAEARAIVAGITARYHRTLEPAVVDALIAHGPAGAEPWRNPLWLALATEELNLVDADTFAAAFARTAALGVGARYEQVLAGLMADMAAGFPADVPGLYRASFDRAAASFGAAARIFIGLIAVGRQGWRESDFRAVMPRLTGQPWDDLAFAQIRRAFRGQLRRRAPADQWDFAHAQMRVAALAWFTESEGPGPSALHTALGDHLLALPPDDPLHVGETMLHLLEGEDWARRSAAYFGSNLLAPPEVAGAVSILAARAGSPGFRSTLDALLAAGLPATLLGVAANRLLFDLADSLENVAALELRSPVILAARDALQRLVAGDPGNAGFLRDLSVSYIKLGDLAVAGGRGDEARDWFGKTLAVAERLAAGDPGNAGFQRDLSVSYNRLGDLAAAVGRGDEARDWFAKALAVAERLAAGDPGNAGFQRDLSVSYNTRGDLAVAAGRGDEARDWFAKALAVAEHLAAGDPGNAGFQRDLSVSYIKLGDLAVAAGRGDEARDWFGEALAARERLAAGDPGNAGFQRDLSVSLVRMGDLAAGGGDPAGAARDYRRALGYLQNILSLEPGNAVRQGEVDLVRRKMAAVEAHAGWADSWDGCIAQADTAHRKDDAAAERMALEAALDRCSDGPPIRRATALARLAGLDLAAGDAAGAVARLAEAEAFHAGRAADRPDIPLMAKMAAGAAVDLAEAMDAAGDPRAGETWARAASAVAAARRLEPDSASLARLAERVAGKAPTPSESASEHGGKSGLLSRLFRRRRA
jgi:tetratricopeptide (TPR) repeat protein